MPDAPSSPPGPGSPPAAARDPLPPRLLERFEILSLLGVGGMGRVHLARERTSGRRVALKTMLPGTEEAWRVRFRREVAALARVRHPNLARFVDAGELPEGPWLATEYQEGRPLGEVSPPADPLPALLQVADALEALHAAGLTHRDVKPGNVLVTPSGVAVLLDLGLVHDPEDERLTTTSALPGTAGFLAPERLRGEAGGPEVDWYAWGASLYHGLEGHPPYPLPDLVRLAAGASLPPPEFRATPREAPVVRLVLATLASDPARRPRGRSALEALLRSPPGPAGASGALPMGPALRAVREAPTSMVASTEDPPSPAAIGSASPPAGRTGRFRLAGLAFGLGLGALAGWAAFAPPSFPSPSPSPSSSPPPTATVPPPGEARPRSTRTAPGPTTSPQGPSVRGAEAPGADSTSAPGSDPATASSRVPARSGSGATLPAPTPSPPLVPPTAAPETGTVATTAAVRVAPPPAPPLPPGTFALRELPRAPFPEVTVGPDPVPRPPLRLEGWSGERIDDAWFLDGGDTRETRLAALVEGIEVAVWDGESGDLVRTLTADVVQAPLDEEPRLEASVTGSWVMVRGRNRGRLLDLRRGRARVGFELDPLVPTELVVHLGIRELGYGLESGGIEREDLATGISRAPLDGHPGGTFSLAYRRDGRRLASSGADGVLRWWELPEGRPAGSASGVTRNRPQGLAFADDGTLAAVSDQDDRVRIFPDEGRTEPQLRHRPGEPCRSLALSADGRWLAVVLSREVEIHDLGAPGEEPRFRLALPRVFRLGEEPSRVDVSFSPDATQLLVAAGRPYLFDLSAGRPRPTGPR